MTGSLDESFVVEELTKAARRTSNPLKKLALSFCVAAAWCCRQLKPSLDAIDRKFDAVRDKRAGIESWMLPASTRAAIKSGEMPSHWGVVVAGVYEQAINHVGYSAVHNRHYPNLGVDGIMRRISGFVDAVKGTRDDVAIAWHGDPFRYVGATRNFGKITVSRYSQVDADGMDVVCEYVHDYSSWKDMLKTLKRSGCDAVAIAGPDANSNFHMAKLAQENGFFIVIVSDLSYSHFTRKNIRDCSGNETYQRGLGRHAMRIVTSGQLMRLFDSAAQIRSLREAANHDDSAAGRLSREIDALQPIAPNDQVGGRERFTTSLSP